MPAETNGKPGRDQVLAATAEERTQLLDRYRDTSRPSAASRSVWTSGAGALPKRASRTSSSASAAHPRTTALARR